LTNVKSHWHVCLVDILRRRTIVGVSISFDSLWKMPDQFNEELGRRIRTAREGKLTQEALGSRIGLSRTAVTNIECGRQRLLVDQLVDIAAAIGVPPSDLLPPAGVGPAAAEADIGINEMPTVQRWITSVRKTAPRGRR
jgi:transcriptional regulator with XRE-family HTH domain